MKRDTMLIVDILTDIHHDGCVVINGGPERFRTSAHHLRLLAVAGYVHISDVIEWGGCTIAMAELTSIGRGMVDAVNSPGVMDMIASKLDADDIACTPPSVLVGMAMAVQPG